jgi:peptidyl-prolyl cis-trans isomerase A (cyclophilin A)
MDISRVIIECELGEIEVDIFNELAPQTSKNFFDYMDAGRFIDTSFFRIVTLDNQPNAEHKIEVVQGGLKFDAGKGYDPEHVLPPMLHESTMDTGIKHRDGTISMGRFAPGETYGSFFFCVGHQPELDYDGRRFPDGKGASAFGTITGGRDVLQIVFERGEDTEFLQEEVMITSIYCLE